MKVYIRIILINFFAVAIILFVVEFSLRLFGMAPSTIARAMYYKNLIGDYEPRIAITDNRVEKYPFEFSTNSQGVRCKREVSREKKDGIFRVLCLGDSFTMGWGVDDEYTYPELLRSLLRIKHKSFDIEVISAGDIFSNVLDQVDYYVEKGGGLNPDLVILQFYPNDIFNEMARGHVDRIEKKHSAPQFEDTLLRRLIKFVQGTATFNFIVKMSVNFVGVERFVGAGATALKADHEILLDSLLVHDNYNASLASDWNELLKDENIDYNYKLWNNYLIALDYLKKKVEGDGAEFLLVAIPSSLQMTKYLNSPSCVFSKYSEESGVKFVDFSSVFRRFVLNDLDNEKFFLKGDGHTNVYGNTLIASTLASCIDLHKQDGRIKCVVNDDVSTQRNCATKQQVCIYASGNGIVSNTQASGIYVSDIYQKDLIVPIGSRVLVENNASEGNNGLLKIDFHSDQSVSLIDIVLKHSIFNDTLKENKLSISGVAPI